jgi:hypothetical protein
MGLDMGGFGFPWGVPNDPTVGLDFGQQSVDEYPWWLEAPYAVPEEISFSDPWAQEVPMSADENSFWSDIYPEDESTWMNAGLESSLGDLQAFSDQLASESLLDEQINDIANAQFEAGIPDMQAFGDSLIDPGMMPLPDSFLNPPPPPTPVQAQSSDIFSQFANVARSVSSLFGGSPAPAQSGISAANPQPQASGISGLISSIGSAVKSVLGSSTAAKPVTQTAKPVAMSTASKLSSLGLPSGSGGLVTVVLVVAVVVGAGLLFKGSK